MSCEVCSTPTTSVTLRDGRSVVGTCPKCSHIERDPKAAPAHHRDVAYGGDPGLDRVRLALTSRTLRRAAPLAPGSRVFEITAENETRRLELVAVVWASGRHVLSVYTGGEPGTADQDFAAGIATGIAARGAPTGQ